MQQTNDAVRQVPKVSEKAPRSEPLKSGDKCDGHCIGNKPGTLGHHDNREPLY